jgi:hypothetical protein
VQLLARIACGDGRPRRLCPFAVKKRIEAVQNATPLARFGSPQPQYEGRATLPLRFDATEVAKFFD